MSRWYCVVFGGLNAMCSFLAARCCMSNDRQVNITVTVSQRHSTHLMRECVCVTLYGCVCVCMSE